MESMVNKLNVKGTDLSLGSSNGHQHAITEHQPDVIALMEPQKWRVLTDILVASNQFIHGYCVDKNNTRSFFITFIYASPDSSKRSHLWNQVRPLEPENNMPWVLGGDLNVICNSLERQRGSGRRSGIFLKFCDFLFDSGLIDLGFNGPCFTCQRDDLYRILDR
ncbi:hypothetical protein F3Y22_tig00112965pilonHSYRG00006 [Hibiscus syriacus]|uniref:Endonuclease/exonuclease/phosphatase domain-containing protein n=1 Tax=Hibiscus syriacus TaxID=106335 RepID=A0A6A2XXU8_HIBSY|nr:hypothetical protein F3Y22_tig00112965pilonHSYRG00006 [Hibiscus syriacus]